MTGAVGTDDMFQMHSIRLADTIPLSIYSIRFERDKNIFWTAYNIKYM
jgi:hypothetical protein